MEELIVKLFSNWVDLAWQDMSFFVLYKLSQLDFWTDLRYAFSCHTDQRPTRNRP